MKGLLPLFAIALPFLWAGLVLGLSFIETPLKFTAPGITLPLGLGIGRQVFKVLNWIEIGLVVVTLAAHGPIRMSVLKRAPLLLVAAIVAAQTLWLLPAMDERTTVVIAGGDPGESYHHVLYVFMEVTKLLMLFAAGSIAWLATSKGSPTGN